MKASSLSLAGSISAKNRTWRSSSNSCCRLTAFLPSRASYRFLSRAFSRLLRRHQQGGQRILVIELGKAALLLQFAGAHHQDPVEIAREARAVQGPYQPAPGH